MHGILKRCLTGVALGTGLFVTGCATDNKPPQSTLVASKQGVMCTKCEATWVKVPTRDQKGRIVAYTTEKKMVCPDCMDSVQSFFNRGKFAHTCKTCGETMEICEVHE